MEVGSLSHSHSQPGEMDRTPPGTPKKGGKMLAVRVQMLDDTVTIFQIQAKALGRVLFDQVCNQLNLLESDYFGLEYQEGGGTKYWLDLEKPVSRQIGSSLVDTLVRFCVKFYTPDPSQLEEEFTRYLFCLQIKRDLSQGLLHCNSNTAALMASYIVQAECGDYVAEDYPDHRYLSSYKFVPNQDQELERKIMENHKKHAGQSPAEADLNLLETARRCDMYGIKFHPAKDHEGCPLNLAVAHMGIVVFQNYSKINTFSWAKMRKLSFKRKKFLVKLHPEGYGYYKDTVDFLFEGRNECKNFWKKCVEYHGFFRCPMVKKVPRQKARVLSRGSSFRYSGRTQKQIVDFVRENYVKRQTFQRSQSFRHSSSAHSSVANVGTSISAHPLLPLGDNAVVGTPASLSCGSMTLTSSPVHAADIHAGGSPSPPLTTSVSPGTSVTSSPKHGVCPLEAPCRRTGHRPSKVKHPPLRSHHAISPLRSPTDAAATAAGNRSASPSNNVAPNARDAIGSPEFIDFNDVYSNCYKSLRNLRNELENDILFREEAKTDIFHLPNEFFNGTTAEGEGSRRSVGWTKSKGERSGRERDSCCGYTWHRSASCKELYREEEREVEGGCGGVCRERSRRKWYSEAMGKNGSIERVEEVGVEERIYSSSYPGTTSDFSRERVGMESKEGGMGEVKYDSQEEMGLSHDDVSHDSYEVIERESDSWRGRGERSRTRSCSWGSDRGGGGVGFGLGEGGGGSGSEEAREERFWSLERERKSRGGHGDRSTSDFWSMGSGISRGGRSGWRYGEGLERGAVRKRELGEGEGRFGKRNKETGEERRRDVDESMGLIEEPRESGVGEASVTVWTEERRRGDKRRERKEREDKFHEGFKEREEKEWERERERGRGRERERRRRRSPEEKEWRGEEEGPMKGIRGKAGDYGNFEEIKFEKFERVVSNQFGRYSEFLTRENTFFAQDEKKVRENYEKVCQVSRMVKEYKNCLSGSVAREKCVERKTYHFGESRESGEWKSVTLEHSGLTADPKGGFRVKKALVERTKSDPYNSMKNHRRNILMHQKSIDITPQQSEETEQSDYDNEQAFKKTSRSEHDIPYILHKRHCMNGTAKTTKSTDLFLAKADFRGSTKGRNVTDLPEFGLADGVPVTGPQTKKALSVVKKSSSDAPAATSSKQRLSSTKVAEAKKAGVQIINLDAKNGKGVVTVERKRAGKGPKSPTTKKPSPEGMCPKTSVRKETRRAERSSEHFVASTEKSGEMEEPIYADVWTEKSGGEEDSLSAQKTASPQPPKRSWSLPQKGGCEEKGGKEGKGSVAGEASSVRVDRREDGGRGEVGFGGAGVRRRREESLTLFARARLGVSEGSAFAGIAREGGVMSPGCQRRAKSLDAPYVSVHSLPPADAFSSKDDTVEGSEGDVVDSAVARLMGSRKGGNGGRKSGDGMKGEGGPDSGVWGNTESEVDSVLTDDLGVSESGLVRAVASESRGEVGFGEEKVLDGVRGKRLLSKIESVDLMDSEGDAESSRVGESGAIPSDRLVNLPESIRFPSVRQISGQTSEESGDGWEQKEVKVKRRTGRRSLGREEEEDGGVGESVVWDSKDEEPPDEEVWDDKLEGGRKYEGVVVNTGLGSEYLKRGSCGQSIDDDNLSTPMKESSPEHWVSVDDLPEALEREEKLLKQQERILREKILNEKLKRELNLDTIDVDERYCKDSARQSRYEEETVSLKENLKGQSLDTYELNEKKGNRERKGKKTCSSLDEGLLPRRLVEGQVGVGVKGKSCGSFGEGMDYIECKVVKDVAEIEEFGENEDELEEFFVVLEENLGEEEEGEGEEKSLVWGDGDSPRRRLSIDESLISVPEEFKDVEEESKEPGMVEGASGVVGGGGVEIRLSEAGASGEEEELFGEVGSEGKLGLLEVSKSGESLGEEGSLRFGESGEGSVVVRGSGPGDVVGGLSPFEGNDKGLEESRKLSLSEDAGRLSPYDGSSRRGSDAQRKLSASEDPGRLSPSTDSRRGSEDPRRLSTTSEDSRKYSASESISEETRRRLSSTEETRRKRASLTKQCSVGADSLSDEMISGIQECSSSFEHDEKDVFEPEVVVPSGRDEVDVGPSACGSDSVGEKGKERGMEEAEVGGGGRSAEGAGETKGTVHLAPPSSERELSRETEDSLDYAEGDMKDMRDAVKEKDMSFEDIASDRDSAKANAEKLGSSQEKSESLENGEFRYIDDKRGSTPEIIVGKSREAVAMSIVVVNEGLSVLEKLGGKEGRTEGVVEREATWPPRPAGGGGARAKERSTLPKPRKTKSQRPKAVECGEWEGAMNIPEMEQVWGGSESPVRISGSRRSESAQDIDLERVSEMSLMCHIQEEIGRKNLLEFGRWLELEESRSLLSGDSGSWKTSSEDDALPAVNQKTSSEERERTDRSSADEFVVGAEETKRKEAKLEKRGGYLKVEGSKGKIGHGVGKGQRSPDQEKRDSGEDGSSSSSAPVYPKRGELSSTWKPFLLESSGSSSLEEGWLPPDENAHFADEEETSSTSNNQQDDSCHDDAEYPTGIGYPVLNASTAEMMVGGYGSVYALSRTLSRISERSMSEQERSDVEDDITKPSSHSASVEEESILSSDHQPSLSSDPPSPKESGSTIPDLPVDRPTEKCSAAPEDGLPVCEPFGDVIPPPVPEEDWPSPPSSSSVMDTPVVSHIETFYMEIHPEEACKVVVAGSREEGGNSSSDENQTLHEESEFLVLSSENVSASTTTTTTTQDGTVVIPVRPKSGKRGSPSEEASVFSTSDWSGVEGASEDGQDWPILPRVPLPDEDQPEISHRPIFPSKYHPEQDSQKSGKMSPRTTKPSRLSSPTGKTFGFFETPVSKVRSPVQSQMKFFETGDRGTPGFASFRSPAFLSEMAGPKTSARFFDASERRTPRSPTNANTAQRLGSSTCYSNVADSAEKSYFGRYDTGSLERTKIHSSRKCSSYYSVSKPTPNEGDDAPFPDGPTVPSSNTIPRASKKTSRRHRVAMNLVVRDGRIVAPPKTNATVLENSDEEPTSPANAPLPNIPKTHSGD